VTRERLLRRRRAIPGRAERAFPPGKTSGREAFLVRAGTKRWCTRVQERHRYVRGTSINRRTFPGTSHPDISNRFLAQHPHVLRVLERLRFPVPVHRSSPMENCTSLFRSPFRKSPSQQSLRLFQPRVRAIRRSATRTLRELYSPHRD